MIGTAQAVVSLRPNTEWTMNGDDVEGIVWHTEGVKPLTQAEVDAEVARLQAIEDARPAVREAALAKLAALGLTTEDLTALGL